MAMCILCAGFVWMTIRARLSLLDRNIGTSARFYAYITKKSHNLPKMLCIFLTGGAYAPYATCTATPLALMLNRCPYHGLTATWPRNSGMHMTQRKHRVHLDFLSIRHRRRSFPQEFVKEGPRSGLVPFPGGPVTQF